MNRLSAALLGASLLIAHGPAAAAPAAGSRVLGKTATVVRGAPACRIRFVYGGRAPETLVWEEPCADVDAQLMTRRQLEALERWERLEAPARRSVEALPGGKVLYIGGSFSASVYPLGPRGMIYEVPVAD